MSNLNNETVAILLETLLSMLDAGKSIEVMEFVQKELDHINNSYEK